MLRCSPSTTDPPASATASAAANCSASAGWACWACRCRRCLQAHGAAADRPARPHLRPGEERHLPLAPGRPAAARDVRPQARRPRRDSRRVQADRHQRARHPTSASCCRAPPAIADKLAVVRSLCTHSDLHDASGYWVLTGYRYTGQQSRQISPTDWPYLGSVVKMLKPSERAAGVHVGLAARRDAAQRQRHSRPGQTAGFLGKRWEPERVIGDPSAPDYRVEGLALPPDMPPLRLSAGGACCDQVERHFAAVERGPALRRLRPPVPGGLRPADLAARRARRSTSAASRRRCASATAAASGASACCWPAG